jgi:hypothetical protein
MPDNQPVIPVERVQRLIYLIRGQKVMLDYDLADLYGVPTKGLKQAVRRNIDRFPSDFMFELREQEVANLRSQIVTSSLSRWGGRRYRPMAFTQKYHHAQNANFDREPINEDELHGYVKRTLRLVGGI